MRGMALAFARRAQPLTIALADTHPGNFIVTSDGTAWFVDLEKVHVGSPAIDLAHATLADLDAVASRGRQNPDARARSPASTPTILRASARRGRRRWSPG